MTTSTPITAARALRAEMPGSSSQELQQRREDTVASGVSSVLPVYAGRARDAPLHDVDGNSLIDFGSGIAVTNISNAAPEVVYAVRQQAGEFTHTCSTVAPCENYPGGCEELSELTSGEHA